MHIAVEVWSPDVDEVLTTAQRAEALGIDGFYYGESPTGLVDAECWTMLAAIARETSRMRIGPVITNVLGPYRSLALLAGQAATVAALSGGRLDFRTGVGAARPFGQRWWEPYGVHYPSYPERLAELAHALDVMTPYWSGEPVHFTADQGPVRLGMDCPPIPVTLAATGPAARDLAATHATWREVSFCTPAEAEAYAKELPEVGLSLEIDGFMGRDPLRVAAVLADARQARSSEDLDAVFNRSLVGTSREVASKLRTLADAGVGQVVVALHNPHDPEALAALAEAAQL